jgi:hypothetical protein
MPDVSGGLRHAGRVICLALLTGRDRAGYLLRYPADLGQIALAAEGHSAEEWCQKYELP